MGHRDKHSVARATSPIPLVMAMTVLAGLSGPGTWGPAPCRSLLSGLWSFGRGVRVSIAYPVCGVSLHDLGSAVIRSGPLAWTICLGTLVVGFITLLNVTGLGLAVLRLRRRVRGWFAKRLGLRLPEPTLPLVSSPPQPFSFVAADSRSTIAGRTPHRRGPPALLVNA